MPYNPYAKIPTLHGACLTHSANQNFGAGSWYTVLFNTLVYDEGSYYSVSVANTLTVPETGYYLVGADLSFNQGGGAYLTNFRVLKNGSVDVLHSFLGSWYNSTQALTMSGMVFLQKGDTLTLQLFSSNNAGTVYASVEYSPRFWVSKLF